MKRFYLAALFLAGTLWPIAYWRLTPVSQRDFGSFWAAGQAIRSGVNPYDLAAFQAFGDRLLGHGFYNYTYPPHGLFLFLPFSYLPANAAFVMWNLFSALFFWLAARPLIPKGLPSILAILSPAALINFNYGQTGLISAGLFLLAFRGSGLAAAALTFKPHLGFLVIPAVAGRRRSFAIAVLATMALVGASALFFGHWYDFLAHALAVQGKMLIDQSQPQWVVMGTTPAHGYGLWGWLLYAAGGLYFLSRNYNVFTAATATFLISPYGLHYDMAAVCLGFAVMLYSQWGRMPAAHQIVASLAFLTPAIVFFGTTFLIPPILLCGLFVQVEWTEGTRLTLSARDGRPMRFRTEAVAPAN